MIREMVKNKRCSQNKEQRAYNYHETMHGLTSDPSYGLRSLLSMKYQLSQVGSETISGIVLPLLSLFLFMLKVWGCTGAKK